MGVNNIDYSTLTVTDSAQVVAETCSPVMPSQAKGALITVETNQIRYREDGTAPSSSEGILLSPGDDLIYDSWTPPGNNWRNVLLKLQVIEVTGTPLLKIHWYD